MLNIEKTQENEKLTVMLKGRLDTVTSPDLEKSLKESLPGVTDLVLDFQVELMKNKAALLLDFQELDYISSAGLRVLLSTQKVMNQQGRMTLCHVNESIMEILEVTGFVDILTIE